MIQNHLNEKSRAEEATGPELQGDEHGEVDGGISMKVEALEADRFDCNITTQIIKGGFPPAIPQLEPSTEPIQEKNHSPKLW